MSSRMPRVTGKQIEKALLRVGWYLHHSRGSYSYYLHPDRPGKQITLPIHARETLLEKMPEIVDTVLEQAGLSLEELLEFL